MAKSTVQVQVAKPATKPATTGKTRAAKPAAVVTPVVAAPTLTHALKDGFRPASGSLLFAYTAAWMNLTGLATGKAVPRSTVSTVAGSTARKYHTEKTGAFSEDASGMLTLTDAGKALFAKRKSDAKHVEAYTLMMTTGQPDGAILKAAHGIQKI